jgi:hypothetical protein
MRSKTKPLTPLDQAEQALAEATAQRDALVAADAVNAAQTAAREAAGRAARAAAEQAASDAVDTAALDLTASRDRLVETATTAQGALVALLAAAAAHCDLVRLTADDLARRGLHVGQGHQTGAHTTATTAVRLRGEWHRRVDGTALLRLVAGRALGEQSGEPGDPGLRDVLGALPAPGLPARPREAPWRRAPFGFERRAGAGSGDLLDRRRNRAAVGG